MVTPSFLAEVQTYLSSGMAASASGDRLFTQRKPIGQRTRRELEPHYEYLDRSARLPAVAIREALESWFSRYPHHALDSALEARQLRQVFHSKEDQQHFSAFWQLFLHELFIRLGYTVTVHPVLPWTSRRPDFLVEKEAERPFIVEATLVTSEEERDTDGLRRLRVVLDTISSWRFDRFALAVDYSGYPPAAPPIQKDLRRRLAAWIEALDPDAIQAEQQEDPDLSRATKYEYEWKSWVLTIRPLPLPPEALVDETRGPLGSYGESEARFCRAAPNLRDAILRKARRYGTPPYAFYVAANTLEVFFRRSDAVDALYGFSSLPLVRTSEGVRAGKPRRGTDGTFIRNGRPIYGRVSGVIVGDILPWTIAGKDTHGVVVYENPYRNVDTDPSPKRALLQLAHCVAKGDSLVFQNGIRIRELFDLPAEWPHFNQEV